MVSELSNAFISLQFNHLQCRGMNEPAMVAEFDKLRLHAVESDLALNAGVCVTKVSLLC